jgi:hypothetical protein
VGHVFLIQPIFCCLGPAIHPCYDSTVEDTQRRALLIAASILAAPKLASQLDSKDSPARDILISDAVRDAAHILQKIDNLDIS